MNWIKSLFSRLLKMIEAEEIEVGGEAFPIDSVYWVSVNEYWRIEKGEPDENGCISEKRTPVIIIVGAFGQREYFGVEPNISKALQLQAAVTKRLKYKR